MKNQKTKALGEIYFDVLMKTYATLRVGWKTKQFTKLLISFVHVLLSVEFVFSLLYVHTQQMYFYDAT